MKRTLRFMVAKYTPDLQRLEPRNCGLVLWTDGGTTLAQFAGERAEGAPVMPALIEKSDRHAYREWLSYWRHQLAAAGIRRQSGEFIERTSPAYLEALREKSKEKFRLVDGGFFTQAIAERELPDVLAEMYQRVVERPEAQLFRAEKMELTDACKKLLEMSGIAERPDVKHNEPVPRHVHGVLRTFTVDLALGPTGHPSAIIHRVLLTRGQNIDSSAFMFETLLGDRDRPIPKDNCAAVVNTNQPLDNEAKAGLRMIQAIVPVIDVATPIALAQMRAINLMAAERSRPL